jgi:chemosensory pili system protein ChpA (sensor histidine kinase/response regulator)
LSKRVELVVIGEDTQLDRTILSRMRAPLEHMLRNAVDHGIETPTEREAKGKPAQGLITLSLYRDGQEVAVKLVDDGAGMDRDAIRQAAIERGLLHPQSRLGESELLQLVLEPAISTSTGVTQISGRGVGMDVVNTEIKELGGTLQILSTPDEGTRFDIRLPFTLAINQALLVSVAAEVFALPLPNVEAVVRVRVEDVEALKQRDNPVFEHAGMEYPFVPLARLLGLSEEHLSRDLSQVPVILLRSGEHCLALLVEEQSGRQEVVVKPVGRQLASIRWITGATILGDGTVVLVLDVPTLVRMGVVSQGLPARNSDTEAFEAAAPARSVMVVDDSITVRRVTDRFLTRNGMRVVTAKDGLEALSLLQDDLPDLMLLDIEMPRMDGFELASTLRGDARTQALPIIMITSRTGKKHSDRARELGVDRYLGKPYHEVELLESINELLGAVVN